MKKTISLSELKRRNQEHHNKVCEARAKSPAMREMLTQREKYFMRLMKIPFFKTILSKRKKFTILIRGKPERVQLCASGIKNINITTEDFPLAVLPTKMAFILDSRGRMRYFCKITHPKVTGALWSEMRGFQKENFFEKPAVFTQSRRIYFGDKEEFEEMRKLLDEHEKEITFDEKFGIKELEKAQTLL